MLPDRNGIRGRDPVTRSEAARRLGVLYHRVCQVEQQLSNDLTRTAQPADVWKQQVTGRSVRGGPTDAPRWGLRRSRSSLHPSDRYPW